MMLNLVIFRLWVTTFTQERAPQQIFTYSKSILETLKRREICSKLTIKTPERRSAVFSINLIHNTYTKLSYIILFTSFLLFLLMTLNKAIK